MHPLTKNSHLLILQTQNLFCQAFALQSQYLNQVLNAPGWKLSGSHCGITGHYALIDPKGEKRRITPFEYHSAIEFPSWEDWDVERERIEREATTVRLKKEADFGIRAKSVLEEVFNINERGGPGSRKQVRALIAQLF